MIEMHHNSNFEEDIYVRNQIPRPCKEIYPRCCKEVYPRQLLPT